jgi:hypothetical protein
LCFVPIGRVFNQTMRYVTVASDKEKVVRCLCAFRAPSDAGSKRWWSTWSARADKPIPTNANQGLLTAVKKTSLCRFYVKNLWRASAGLACYLFY